MMEWVVVLPALKQSFFGCKMMCFVFGFVNKLELSFTRAYVNYLDFSG